ncbi:MAG: flagellar basal body protein, partial [Oscillospiraceae bacterium]|nr:flagellar basal body protein [Oscillospiraceae bacterium]
MRSSFIGMEVQKRTLHVAQKSLDIVGHNIANQDTPGYTRQRVDLHSMNLSSFTYWQTRLSKLSLAGQGVSAFGVSQIRNDYLDKRYRDMAPQAKEYDTKIKIMLELETTLDAIDNFSLLDAFHNLKSAMQQVSLVSPDALEMTGMVRNQAENICRMLRSYSADLEKLLQRNLEDLHDTLNGANSLIDRIVQYNKAITGEYLLDAGRIARGSSVSEYGPLEMIDGRNLLLDELADYGNIEVFHNANGSVRVEMAGVTIIDDQFSEKLVMREYDNYGAAYITFSNGIDFKPTYGEIKAYMDMVGGYGPYAVGAYQNSEYGIPYYMQALDAFAEGFVSLMNEVNKGYMDDYQAWNRNLLWGGYEIDSDGRRVPLLDDDGYKIFLDNDGVRLPWVDDNGNEIEYPGRDPLYVKSKVTAANIRISDEWMKDVMMIGQTFDPTIPETIREYREGAVYHKGDAFYDPATGLYCIVQSATFTASGELGQHIQSGAVKDIPVYREIATDYNKTKPNFAPNYDPVKNNYKEG